MILKKLARAMTGLIKEEPKFFLNFLMFVLIFWFIVFYISNYFPISFEAYFTLSSILFYVSINFILDTKIKKTWPSHYYHIFPERKLSIKKRFKKFFSKTEQQSYSDLKKEIDEVITDLEETLSEMMPDYKNMTEKERDKKIASLEKDLWEKMIYSKDDEN